jgi:chemotaxis regulatin CheY-phosphate phosphatase CheZ
MDQRNHHHLLDPLKKVLLKVVVQRGAKTKLQKKVLEKEIGTLTEQIIKKMKKIVNSIKMKKPKIKKQNLIMSLNNGSEIEVIN